MGALTQVKTIIVWVRSRVEDCSRAQYERHDVTRKSLQITSRSTKQNRGVDDDDKVAYAVQSTTDLIGVNR